LTRRSAIHRSDAEVAVSEGEWPAGALILAAIGLAAMTVVAYLPALRGDFIWDDDRYVSENPTLTSPGGLLRIWFKPGATPQYYPLVFTTFWIEYRLWGLNTLGYHLVNVALHAASAVLLWRLLRRLGIPGAFLAACIFAVHPVHVESVAWITERKNVLSGFFYLAALRTYLMYCGFAGERTDAVSAPIQNPASGSRNLYVLTLLLFLCALLSKTVTCSLPAAIVLLVWWKRGAIRTGDVRPLLPMFALGLIAGLFTSWLEKTHVGAEGADWDFTVVERCLIAGRAVWFYLGKLLWPDPLIFIYPRWHIDAAKWAQYLYPAAALILLVFLYAARRRIGRAPLVVALFFGGTLLPALGFVNVFPMRFSFVADHFQYLASIGPIALFAGLFGRRPPMPLRAIPVVIVAALVVLTFRQARHYRSGDAIYLDTLAKNPGAWMARNNLALLMVSRGEYREAADHLEKALADFPDYAYAHNNLAMILLKIDSGADAASKAIGHLREAIRLDPGYADAHGNLGIVLARQGQRDEALACFREAAKRSPDNFKAHYNLGYLLLQSGRAEEALPILRHARRIDPASRAVLESIREAEKMAASSAKR